MRIERTDEGLWVRDFDMATHLLKSDRTELQKDIGPDYYKEALVVDKLRRAKGKKAAVFMNHTDKEDSRIVGSIEQMKYMNHKLYGDLLITDEDVARKFEAGELQERSIEFSQDTPFIAGVALLDSTEGHFSEELSPVPMGKYDHLEKDEDLGKITLVSLTVNKNTEGNTNMEELKQILDQLKSLNSRIEKLETPKQSEDYDPFAEKETIDAQVKAQAEAMALESSLKNATELWVLRLERVGCSLTSNQIRRKLSSAKSMKELDYEGQILELKSRGGVKLEAEPDASNPDEVLRLEFEKGQKAGKFKTLSLEDYKRINQEFVR